MVTKEGEITVSEDGVGVGAADGGKEDGIRKAFRKEVIFRK